jgi:4a-hydroxytetrahydrobiopterin dehydratase
MSELAAETCVPCRADTPPLKGDGLLGLAAQVPEWEVVEEHHLRRGFRFKNFREALVGSIGERNGLRQCTSWGAVAQGLAGRVLSLSAIRSRSA